MGDSIWYAMWLTLTYAYAYVYGYVCIYVMNVMDGCIWHSVCGMNGHLRMDVI